MNIEEYVRRWTGKDRLGEFRSAQSNFNDLCDLVGVPRPCQANPDHFCFQKAVDIGGAKGFIDVWKDGHFVWEYKGRQANLAAARKQAAAYLHALPGNQPPLIVVSTVDLIRIHTAWTGTIQETYDIRLDKMLEEPERTLELLDAVFNHPERLKPGTPSRAITEEHAREFSDLSAIFRATGLDTLETTKFVTALVAAFFLQDTALKGSPVTDLFRDCADNPETFPLRCQALFAAFRDGSPYGPFKFPVVCGPFASDVKVPLLDGNTLSRLANLSARDWRLLDPALFGHLYKGCAKDPKKTRYTHLDDIKQITETVIFQDLRRKEAKAFQDTQALEAWHKTLSKIVVFSPACGSGGFLSLTMREMQEMERAVLARKAELGLPSIPAVGPHQFLGMDIDPHACAITALALWIGDLQWRRANKTPFPVPAMPDLPGIQCRDALLDRSVPGRPVSTPWPFADYVVGNPQFLGWNRFRKKLSKEWVADFHKVTAGNLPAQADLACAFLFRANLHSAAHGSRVGLMAPDTIRQGAGLEVLQKIKATANVFFGVTDKAWPLDDSGVRVCMIGFDAGTPGPCLLNGKPVSGIAADLSEEKPDPGFQVMGNGLEDSVRLGTFKAGPLDLPAETAEDMLRAAPKNAGCFNSSVLYPMMNGRELSFPIRPRYFAFFEGMSLEAAERHEAVFRHIKDATDRNGGKKKDNWWLPGQGCLGLLTKLTSLTRYMATPYDAGQRFFAWVRPPTIPDHQIVVIARSDDFLFGLLNWRGHAVWAEKVGTRLIGSRSARYTPFVAKSFPFPPTPAPELRKRLETAAVCLAKCQHDFCFPETLVREEVLTFSASVGSMWGALVRNPGPDGIGTVNWKKFTPVPGREQELAERTLTKLHAHPTATMARTQAEIDTVVSAMYGWPDRLPDEALFEKLKSLHDSKLRNSSGGGVLELF